MVICQLYEAGRRLYVSYIRKYSDYLSATLGRIIVICQLQQAGWCLYVIYMRKVGGILSDT